MKAKTNWYKYGVWVAAIIILLLLVRSCGNGGTSFFSCNKPDTTRHTIDTTIYKDSIVYVDKPVPYKVEIFIKGKPYAVHDTVTDYLIHPTDTAAILQRFLETVYYSQVYDVKRGTIIINDTLTQNRISGRGLLVNISDTTIKETIILQQPKRLILYFGINAMGNRKDFFHSIGSDLSLKGNNDMIYGAGVNIMRGGEIFYTGKVMFPIRFNKK